MILHTIWLDSWKNGPRTLNFYKYVRINWSNVSVKFSDDGTNFNVSNL